MNKKMILGVVLLAGAGAFMFKDKLFGSSAAGNSNTNSNYIPGDSTGNSTGGSNSPYPDGTVLRAEGEPGWYKIINGKRVVYTSFDAYKIDGSPVVTDVSLAALQAVPLNTVGWITESGITGKV